MHGHRTSSIERKRLQGARRSRVLRQRRKTKNPVTKAIDPINCSTVPLRESVENEVYAELTREERDGEPEEYTEREWREWFGQSE